VLRLVCFPGATPFPAPSCCCCCCYSQKGQAPCIQANLVCPLSFFLPLLFLCPIRCVVCASQPQSLTLSLSPLLSSSASLTVKSINQSISQSNQLNQSGCQPAYSCCLSLSLSHILDLDQSIYPPIAPPSAFILHSSLSACLLIHPSIIHYASSCSL